MNLFPERLRQIKRYSYSTGITDNLIPLKTHIKPYTNISDLPQDILSDLKINPNSKDFSSDFHLIDISQDPIIHNSDSVLKLQLDQEDIKRLNDSSDPLRKQNFQSKPLIRSPHAPDSRNQKSDSDSRLVEILEYENKKLKASLKNAEINIERLYKEISILGEQLTIYQKKIERFPEYETYPENTNDQRLITTITNELNKSYQDLTKKVALTEKRLEVIVTRQLRLNKQFNDRTQEFLKISKANEKFKGQSEQPCLESKQKIDQYEKEIYQLGVSCLKAQERMEKSQIDSEQAIAKLNSENSKLKQELNGLSQTFLQETQMLSPKLKKRNASSQNLAFAKLSPYVGKGIGLNTVKTDSRTKPETIQKVECLNISNDEQMEKLSKELEDIRHSYASLEIHLMKTQEAVKLSEENKKRSEEALKSNIENLKIEITALEEIIESQKCEIIQLNETNCRQTLDIQSFKKEELVSKCNRLVIDLRTNEEILENMQQELQYCKSTIKEQSEIINSLKSGFYPHNSRRDLLHSTESSIINNSEGSQKIDSSSQSFTTKTSNSIPESVLHENKDDILQALRLQYTTLSQDYEVSLKEQRKYQELFNSTKNECQQLEDVLEGLQYELLNIKAK